MATSTPSAQHVFRQRSSVWLAVMSGFTGLLLLGSLARNWGTYPRPLFGAWVLLGLAVAWSVFVRPAVVIDAGGVTLRNILRDVHIPWTRVSDVTFRWNLKVMVGDKGYNSWAISSQVERPRRVSGGMLGMPAPGHLDGVSNAGARLTTPAMKVTAESVAQLIEQAKEEYDDAVADGELPGSDGIVRIIWVPLVMAVLLVPAVAVAALSLG